MNKYTQSADKNIVAIIQARMTSSRLPGKVLLNIGGRPMLAWVVERAKLATLVNGIVVATTTDESDQPIEQYCFEQGYRIYRGSQYDVLDRYYQAARVQHADVIVRITADCPLIDPQLIDETISAFLNAPGGCDFAANRLPPPWGRTYPIGMDTEVCSMSALEIAWKEAKKPHQREHVMPFFYEHPERFRIQHINYAPTADAKADAKPEVDYGKLRWTVDTPEDLIVIRNIVDRLTDKTDFSWLDILGIIEQEPELTAENAHIQPKDFRQFDERQKEKHREKTTPH